MDQQRRSDDEQMYQDNKAAPDVHEVYSNETESASAQRDVVGGASQDEASAESFPASDAPAANAGVPGEPEEPQR